MQLSVINVFKYNLPEDVFGGVLFEATKYFQ